MSPSLAHAKSEWTQKPKGIGDRAQTEMRRLLSDCRGKLRDYISEGTIRCDSRFEDRKNDSRKGAKIPKMDENSLGKEIVDAAIAVYRELGPGLLETVYEVVLLDEIRKRGFSAERQVPIAIVCRGVCFDEGFRADMIVEGLYENIPSAPQSKPNAAPACLPQVAADGW